MNSALKHITQSVKAAWTTPFRGQIYDYARKLRLAGGYAVKGRVEIVQTLHHLVQPLRAIRSAGVRIVSIIGAVQTTKSLLLDVLAPYRIEHDPGDCLWLLEDDPKAREYADRCIPLIHSVPEIASLLEGVDRHDKTKTALRFRHMKIVMAGLNPGNVQSLSWRYVNIDETWLHPADGLLRQAIDRCKQYPDTCKIILIGQGGVEGDDHDQLHKETDRRELHYACPACGKYQPFTLSRQRDDGTYAGLSWDTNETTKPVGKWDFDAVAATAHHRCFYCDHRINDTAAERRQLHDSYAFFPTDTSEAQLEEFRTRAAGKTGEPFEELQEEMFPFGQKVGFHWPAEASMRLSFGGLVSKYLRAKVALEEMAYRLPMQEFYQKDRGQAWSETVEADYKLVKHEPYDVQSQWPEEAYRFLVADCQRDLKKFYFQVFAVALTGESRELDRGIATAFGDPKKPTETETTLAGIQSKWNVKDQHTFLDCGYEMTKVLRECVRHGHVASIKTGGRVVKVWRSWTGLKGSAQEVFQHLNPKTKVKEFRIYSERKLYNTSIGTSDRLPRAPWYELSNLHCKDLLAARRDGDNNAPKFLTLPDTMPANDPQSYFAQMRSEVRTEVYSGGKKRSIWTPVSKIRPNHFWDCGQMLMGVQAIVGIIGGEAADSGQ